MKKLLVIFISVVALLHVVSCSKKAVEDEPQVEITTPPQGTVDTIQTVASAILGIKMHYSVYLPPSYSKTTDNYPVLYLLHGMYGDYRDWVKNGMASITDLAIYNAKSKEMVVIMPNGFNAFYCNNFNGGNLKYEDFFIQEFIPQIESKYRIKTTQNGRSIAGLSMGGYGATYHAFKRPELFCAAYAISGAMVGTTAPDIKVVLDARSAEELKKLPAYTMECGTEDFLVFGGNENFDQYLTNKGIAHNYIKRNGTHDWTFWKACLPRTLEMVSKYVE